MAISMEQQEEMEVLSSIFEGDEAFQQISDHEFQYKVGENGASKSFLLGIKWPEEYPGCKPCISLDAFYNKHIIDSVKQNILDLANEQADMMLGAAATYTIIDWAKENCEMLMAEQPEFVAREQMSNEDNFDGVPTKKKREKKEQLTKAQKRKLADRINASGERPRGWDWIDIVKHLSRTGGSTDA